MGTKRIPEDLTNVPAKRSIRQEIDHLVPQIAETEDPLTPAFSDDSWIPGRKPNPQARLRLFCFPYAGGAASLFRNWSESVPTDIDVCAVQFPGRGSRLLEPPFTRLPPLVEALEQALHPLFDKPFALFGHSLGALVSFELARRLGARYRIRPVRLIVSAAPAPQIPRRGLPIRDLSESELSAELRRLNGTPGELLNHKELMDIALPLVRADLGLYQNYLYSSELPLACPISAYHGINDENVKRCDLEKWRDQTTGSFSIRSFPGDHFFLRTAEKALLKTICQELR
jgi:medium-chain acyl-[acyl-carrier-protein] hydrolase